MRANVAYRGKERVVVGSMCKKGSHCKCFVQNCKCPCHPKAVEDGSKFEEETTDA